MNTRSILSGLTLFIEMALSTTHALSQTITPLSQARSIRASAFVTDGAGTTADTDQNAASDFGLFNAFVGAGASRDDMFASATAEQNAAIGAQLLTATGRIDANGSVVDPTLQTAGGDAQSSLRVVFTVDAAVSYRLMGDIATTSTGFASAGPSVVLQDTSANLFETVTFDNETFDVTGVFVPSETYTLEALTSGSAQTFEFSQDFFSAIQSSFSLQLTLTPSAVPEPTGIGFLAAGGLSLLAYVRRRIRLKKRF
jgi:hypothetical protein